MFKNNSYFFFTPGSRIKYRPYKTEVDKEFLINKYLASEDTDEEQSAEYNHIKKHKLKQLSADIKHSKHKPSEKVEKAVRRSQSGRSRYCSERFKGSRSHGYHGETRPLLQGGGCVCDSDSQSDDTLESLSYKHYKKKDCLSTKHSVSGHLPYVCDINNSSKPLYELTCELGHKSARGSCSGDYDEEFPEKTWPRPSRICSTAPRDNNCVKKQCQTLLKESASHLQIRSKSHSKHRIHFKIVNENSKEICQTNQESCAEFHNKNLSGKNLQGFYYIDVNELEGNSLQRRGSKNLKTKSSNKYSDKT